MRRDSHHANIRAGRDGLWLEIDVTPGEPMVWAGKRAPSHYHAQTCEMLPADRYELALSEARECGLAPCPVCQDAEGPG